MIDSAPAEEPKPEQYPNKIAYLKAKLRFQMAKKYGTEPTEPTPTVTPISASPASASYNPQDDEPAMF